MVVWSWREGFYRGLRLEVVSVSFNKGNEPTLVQEHADTIVLSSRLMRHLSLAIPDEHVGPNAHCQLDQSEVPPACFLECRCQVRTSRRKISAESRQLEA